MKAVYDPETDTLSIVLRNDTIVESDEIREGLILDYAEDGKVVSIEVLDASEQLAEPQTFTYEVKEIHHQAA